MIGNSPGPQPLPTLHAEAAAHIRFVVHEDASGAPDDVRVERFFPAPHHTTERLRSVDSAELCIGEAALHFSKIGIRTPTIYENKIVPAGNDFQIVSTVEYVPHRPLVYRDDSKGTLTINPADEDIALGIIDEATDYYAWAKASGRPRCLADASKMQQYGVAVDTGKAILLDTDPYLQRTTPYMLSRNTIDLLAATALLHNKQSKEAAIDKIFASGLPLVV